MRIQRVDDERRTVASGILQTGNTVERVAVGVVEVKRHVFTQPLTQAELQRVVVRSRESRERGERSKLRLIEHIVQLRRTTTERASGAVRTVVPKQLQERPVRDATAIKRRRFW